MPKGVDVGTNSNEALRQQHRVVVIQSIEGKNAKPNQPITKRNA